jgi:hypothetical protein
MTYFYVGSKTTHSSFGPDHLSKLVSENPHIPSYARILQIQLNFKDPAKVDESSRFHYSPPTDTVCLVFFTLHWKTTSYRQRGTLDRP